MTSLSPLFKSLTKLVASEGIVQRLIQITLALMLAMIICMPLMERVLTFDHFPKTGHDFEFETFCFITVLAMYLLLVSLPVYLPILPLRRNSTALPPHQPLSERRRRCDASLASLVAVIPLRI